MTCEAGCGNRGKKGENLRGKGKKLREDLRGNTQYYQRWRRRGEHREGEGKGNTQRGGKRGET